MIQECEGLCDLVSKNKACEEQNARKNEQYLFLNMVQKMNTQESGTKDNIVSKDRSVSKEHAREITPMKTPLKLTGVAFEMDMLLQDLVNSKRMHRVSEHSIVSDYSVFDGGKELKSDDASCESSIHHYRKHDIDLPHNRSSKKQRCS
mmetsp:Transcript_2660/g.6230  ORF Transcript_2660/g.6230 Transcript_2660/m.6230 type:complete len:148 (-) Transcript_2660:47-490(-)